MDDPIRLSDDEQDPLARALLRAGQREAPRGRALERTVTALGVGGALIGTSKAALGAGTFATTKIFGITLLKWVGASALGGLVVVGASRVFSVGSAPPPNERAVPALSASAFLRTPASAAERPDRSVGRRSRSPASVDPDAVLGEPEAAGPVIAEPTPERRGTPAAAVPEVEEATVRTPVNAPRTDALSGTDPRSLASEASTADVTPSELAAEVALLDEARDRLASGNGRGALEVLRRYRVVTARPRLGPEARYLELEAVVLLRDAAAARRVATRLLEDYPRGPHAARARRVLDQFE